MRGNETASPAQCPAWCAEQAVQACIVRAVLLTGGEVRCGYDSADGLCALFFAHDLDALLTAVVAPTQYAFNSSCSLAISEELTICDNDDPCEELGLSKDDAEEACSAVDCEADLFTDCVFDWCVSGGDIDLVNASSTVCDIDEEESDYRPPSLPPSPPATPLPPSAPPPDRCVAAPRCEDTDSNLYESCEEKPAKCPKTCNGQAQTSCKLTVRKKRK